MANKSIGSTMIREIIRMKGNGPSNCKISKSLGKSRTTIVKYLGVIEASGISTQELLELNGEDLSELFEVCTDLNPTNREQVHKDLYSFFPYVEKELKRVGVTRQILWEEYKSKHPEGVMYSQFCEHYLKWIRKSEGYTPTTPRSRGFAIRACHDLYIHIKTPPHQQTPFYHFLVELGSHFKAY